MSSDDESDVPEHIKSQADGIVENLLPEKSKERYIKAYDDFQTWKTGQGIKTVSESVLLVYFQHLSCTKKSSSLWCHYSMLRSIISVKLNIQINTYTKLLAFLKRKSEGHRAKKSKVLTAQNIECFLNEAPDHSYLAVKVVLILGVNGACRGDELVNMKTDDIQQHSELLLVNLPDTKTKRERSFVVRGEYARIVKKYRALRPSNMNTNRLFVNYRDGKCTRQVIGKNKINGMPKEIAKYLKLADAELYTGHCFRRTSATLLADSGADITQIKRHGGWKSDAVAEGYIENSVQNKNRISCRISDNINLKPSSTNMVVDSWTPLSQQPSTSKDLPQTPLSPTFTIQSDLEKSQVSESLPGGSTQINANSTSINVPNKNITLSFHNWTNVSNITFNF